MKGFGLFRQWDNLKLWTPFWIDRRVLTHDPLVLISDWLYLGQATVMRGQGSSLGW